MLRPLQQWVCDTCGELIKRPEHGYLEWVYTPKDGRDRAHSFRIVHHAPRSPRCPDRHCYQHEQALGRADLSLDRCVGATGMVLLLSFLDVGPYHDPKYDGPRVINFREFTEIARRLLLPYYEEAHLYWKQAIGDGFLSDANEKSVYSPTTLKALVQHYRKKKAAARPKKPVKR